MGGDDWPALPGSGPGPGGGGAVGGEGLGPVKKSYSGIAAINKSIRDDKNVLEVRLERSEGARFNLSMVEQEGLLKKLGIDGNHFTGVSSCPEGKGVVYITLHPSVNITRFLYKNEAYVLKEGVQTSVIRPAGKKEVSVMVSGLHPNTKDQAVIRYMAAHGKVSQSDKVVHHVYPGKSGSSLLAGKLNGNRSYMVEVTKHMGSYHIIDGEKVSIKYRGQTRSCARCHMAETQCPGKGVARDCSSDRVLLSVHMEEHWKIIGYTPDASISEDVDGDLEVSVQIGPKTLAREGPDLTMRYNSVIINGFLPGTELTDVHKILLSQGLPPEISVSAILRKENAGKITIENLEPETCLMMMDKMHGKVFLKRKVFLTSVVAGSPQKSPQNNTPAASASQDPPVTPTTPPPAELCHSATPSKTGSPEENSDASAVNSKSSNSDADQSSSQDDSKSENGSLMGPKTPIGPGIQEKLDIFDAGQDKRKADGSPELSKKDKKKLKEVEKAQRKQEYREKKQLNLSQN